MKRLAMLLAALALLAGCTTIPTSSGPQVVRTVPKADASQTPQANTGPQPGAGPQAIMEGFQKSELVADGGHSQSRQYLTNAASRKWQDDTTVILEDITVVQVTISGDTATATVSGRRVGFIDSTGVLTPTLKGTGTGDEESFSYNLVRRAGQWRIDALPPGTLISEKDFPANFHLLKLYFFDSSNTYLVPDLRYSGLTGQGLASWLLARLLDGWRPELQSVVTNNVPDPVGKPTVTVGDSLLTVDIPGAGQLTSDERDSLAAQLAFTFGQVTYFGAALRLTDGGRPVAIPAASGPTFSAADYASDLPDSQTSDPNSQSASAQYYFLRDGVLVNGLTGGPYSTASKFTSVAAQQISAQGTLTVAAVTESDRLVVGPVPRLEEVKLPAAPTSRPEWGPQGDDLWIAAGSTIYRVMKGKAAAVSVTTPAGGPPTGTVTAIRFSPDGVRVALVIQPAKGVGTLWIGSVVTSGTDVRLDALEPITPPAIAVSDVAWSDQSKLFMIAAFPGGSASVFDLESDGSQLTEDSSLPGSAPPTSITAAPGQSAIVSANGLLYEQILTSWANLGGKGTQAGTAPIYAD